MNRKNRIKNHTMFLDRKIPYFSVFNFITRTYRILPGASMSMIEAHRQFPQSSLYKDKVTKDSVPSKMKAWIAPPRQAPQEFLTKRNV